MGPRPTKMNEKPPNSLQPRTESLSRGARCEDREALADPVTDNTASFDHRSPASLVRQREVCRTTPPPLRERIADNPRRVLLLKTRELRICLVQRVRMAPLGPPMLMKIHTVAHFNRERSPCRAARIMKAKNQPQQP